jgi:hypothetical protein
MTGNPRPSYSGTMQILWCWRCERFNGRVALGPPEGRYSLKWLPKFPQGAAYLGNPPMNPTVIWLSG